MKNILLFASCERSFNEQNNVFLSLSKRNCNVLFLYTKEKTTQFPTEDTIQNFEISHNFDLTTEDFKYKFSSLGTLLPFIPDVLIVSREAWMPETRIIDECKRYGSIVCCIENSSWLYNNIKTRLEIISRFRYPTNSIDIFFEQSNWSMETKKLAGWISNKSVITGIPKFDSINFSQDNQKKYVIVYGSMEKNIHPKIMSVLSELISSQFSKDYRICYKPHPKEFEDFSKELKSELFDSVLIIDKEENLFDYVKDSICNIGIFSSVMMYPLLLNRKILYIDGEMSGVNEDLDFEKFKGHEYEFWKGIVNVNSFEEFKSKIGESRIEEFKVRYKSLIDFFKSKTDEYNINLVGNEEKIDYIEMRKYFDEFNDGKSADRISDYILSLFK